MKKRFFGILLMGAMVIASMSMFTSCKDYDDDINSVKNDVTALRTELATLKTTLTNDLSTAKSQLESAIAAKASATDLANLAARVAALETQIKAIDNCATKSDVAELATTIATLTGDITTLQAALAAKANSTDLEAYAKDAALKAAEANIALQQTAIASLQTSLESLASKVEALSAAKGDKEAIEAIQTKLAAIQSDLAKCALSSDVATLTTQMNGLSQSVSDAVDAVNVLTVLVNKKLTSLVFRPDLYLDGIEAVEVLSLKDTVLALVDEKKRAQVTELWGVKGSSKVAVPDSALTTWYGPQYYLTHGWTNALSDKNTVTYFEYAPLSVADFHMNPTTANLDGAKLSFYTNVAHVEDWIPWYTRAEGPELATPVPATIEKTSDFVKNGILSVPFSVDRNILNGIRYKTVNNVTSYTDNEAWIALQAEVNDTVVTSDYALLAPRDIEIVALGGTWMHKANENHKIGTDHLWTKLIAPAAVGKNMPCESGFVLYQEGKLNNVPYYSPVAAVTPKALTVEYNGNVDLSKVVTTHFRYGYRNPSTYAGDTWDEYDSEMTEEMMKALKLHYEFEAIHYISGSNKTDEWEHIQLSGDNNCIATPRSVTEDGKQIPDEVAGREVIGRMPIVRATLVSDETNEVLAVGYILLEIVSKNIATADVTIDLPDAYMNCTAPAAITWAQVEALILKEVQLSKTEFEALYELETVAMGADFDGRYFSQAGRWGDKILKSDVQKTAKQYVKVGNSWTSIYDINKAVMLSSAWRSASTDEKKAALLTYPLGSVYEHKNGEQQQTTVLEWNVGSQVDPNVANTYDVVGTWNGGQSKTVSIAKAIAASGATAASKGLSTEVVEVTVAYKQKDQNRQYIDTNAIYVTLRIPVGKLHFAYAEVSGKDLSHWYQNNNYLNAAQADESDAAEIHINVPTPALGGSGLNNGLQDIDFGKVLDQTFMKNRITPGSFDADHFSKFTNVDFSFRLVAPKKDNVIAWNLDAKKQKLTGEGGTKTDEIENSWIVNGVTGNQYLVFVNTNGNQDWIEIAGYKDVVDGKVHSIANSKEKIVVKLVRELNNAVTGGKGAKIAVMPNRYAQDIINYVGRYDMFANDNNTTYLDSEDKTFTAFIGIEHNSDCYSLMMPNSYFKARFLRPINATRLEKKWTDAVNVVQTVDVAKDLVKLIDWRGYQLTTANDDSKKTVDAKFYGIADSTYHHFYVDTTAIYTDHGLAVGSRVVKNTVAEIEALAKREDFESLKSKFLYFDGTKGTLNYRNNETNVGTFHLYVPVFIAYSFGEFDYNGVYNGISSSKDAKSFNFKAVTDPLYTPWNGNRGLAGDAVAKEAQSTTPARNDIKVPLYTLKTYAVITVEQTTNSGTQTARNK